MKQKSKILWNRSLKSFGQQKMLTSGLALFLSVVLISIAQLAWAQSNFGNGLIEKEVLFLKWGTEDSQVGLSKTVENSGLIAQEHKIQAEIDYKYPRGFQIDEDANVYIIDSVNRRVQVFDKDGNFLKSVPSEKLGVVAIEEDGDIYLSEHSKDYKTSYIKRISKEGKQTQFTFPIGWHVSGNKFVDKNGKVLSVIADKKNVGIANVPIKLIRGEDFEYGLGGKKNFKIKVSKINDRLQVLQKKADYSDISLPVIQKKGFPNIEVLGADNDGNIYLFYDYYEKHVPGDPEHLGGTVEEDVYVYSLTGTLKNKIPLPINVFSRDYDSPPILRSNGDLYHMWISKDGVHIYKWSSK